MLSLYATGYLFYNFRIPERWFPKTFDFIGSSHQFWHIFTAMAGIYWWYTLARIIQYRTQNTCNILHSI